MIKSLATPVNASCWTRYSRHVRFRQPHHKMGLDVPVLYWLRSMSAAVMTPTRFGGLLQRGK
jgi:hypothetical protein